MKKIVVLLTIMLVMPGWTNAATKLLTVKFEIPNVKIKCSYIFSAENNKVRYEVNPISILNCPRTLDMKQSTVDTISVTIPITHVMIDKTYRTCQVKITRLTPDSSYVYVFERSNRSCSNNVKVTLQEAKF